MSADRLMAAAESIRKLDRDNYAKIWAVSDRALVSIHGRKATLSVTSTGPGSWTQTAVIHANFSPPKLFDASGDVQAIVDSMHWEPA